MPVNIQRRELSTPAGGPGAAGTSDLHPHASEPAQGNRPCFPAAPQGLMVPGRAQILSNFFCVVLFLYHLLFAKIPGGLFVLAKLAAKMLGREGGRGRGVGRH